ncbi:MAG: hypothetical protein EOP83_11795 [Verrucomicrobiaceae bacterium]|nr:MAG: hypothetical protein EOP83_11795 [Verrucomicrobiaceae bacterium]
MATFHTTAEQVRETWEANGYASVLIRNTQPDPSWLVKQMAAWVMRPDKPGEVWYDYEVQKESYNGRVQYVFHPVFYFTDPHVAFEFKLHWG